MEERKGKMCAGGAVNCSNGLRIRRDLQSITNFQKGRTEDKIRTWVIGGSPLETGSKIKKHTKKIQLESVLQKKGRGSLGDRSGNIRRKREESLRNFHE